MLKKTKTASAIREYPYSNIAYRIPLTTYPHPKDYKIFWKTYETEGYSELVNRFFDNSVKKRIRYEIRKIAKLLKLC